MGKIPSREELRKKGRRNVEIGKVYEILSLLCSLSLQPNQEGANCSPQAVWICLKKYPKCIRVPSLSRKAKPVFPALLSIIKI